MSCCKCCLSDSGDRPGSGPVTQQPRAASVLWHGDDKFSKCVEEFFGRVRSGLSGDAKRKFKLEKWSEDMTRHITTVVVVPVITRLGIDVDDALKKIQPKIPNGAPLVVLVLHNQAMHIDEVFPSKQLLTGDKYNSLRAILDLQIYNGEMRHTTLNSDTAKKLADLLSDQEGKSSPNRPLISQEGK